MQTTFATMLKDWRARRRMSQLDLGLRANVSARHIAFLETGRSRPSRSMVIQLSEALEIPRIDRNRLLNSAGFSQAYRRRDLAEADMMHIRAAVDWTLERHAPYPAMALDRHWTVVAANRPGESLLGVIGVATGESFLDAMLRSAQMRETFENWPEVARHMLIRLRTESAHLGGDPVLDRAADLLGEEIGAPLADEPGMMPAVLPTRYRAGDQVFSLFSTIAQFGTAEDIALSELRIELIFPADEATRQALIALADATAL